MILKLLSFLVQRTIALPNLLLPNQGNFYLFLLNFGYAAHYLRLTSFLSSGVPFVQKFSFFPQKITPVARRSSFFTSRMTKKVRQRKSQLTNQTLTPQHITSFWSLSSSLIQRKFQLIGLPYNKKRFAFLDTLTQNRLNPGLKVSTVRRHTFTKFRKARVKFFLSALGTKKLLITTPPHFRVRRATNLRGVNPYLFLIRRTSRRTTPQTYVNYLLLSRLKSSANPLKLFKRNKLFTPQITFYFWKRYFGFSVKELQTQPLFRRFRKRWYRWKCLSTEAHVSRQSLRRSAFNLATQTVLKNKAYIYRQHVTYARSLLQPFKFNPFGLAPKHEASSSGISKGPTTEKVFFRFKRKSFSQNVFSTSSMPVMVRTSNPPKLSIQTERSQKFLTNTDFLFFFKRSKRRSFKQGIRLQLRAKRNYVSLARKWGYLTSRTWSMGRIKEVQAAFKGCVFWAKAVPLRGPCNLMLRPALRKPTFGRTQCEGYLNTPTLNQQHLFKLSLHTKFVPITFKKVSLSDTRNITEEGGQTRFPKQFIAPIFATTFTRCTFFFLYLLRGLQTYTDLNKKADFFKTSYTFVNTSTLKRSLLRRVVRTTLHLKRFFTPQHSAQQTRLGFPGLGTSTGILGSTPQTKLTLPSYTNSRITRIPRVRFKPGYARQWRFFRSDVKHFLGIKTRYQYRLTTLIQRLFYSNRKANGWDLQTRITPFLVQSRLVPDVWSASELLKGSSVFVNGYVCTNTFLNVVFSDFVQLVINVKYYVVHKWLVNWNLRNSTRVLQLNRKFNQKKRVDGLSYKPKTLPDWVFRIRYSNYDVPRYVEVDFFTLSVFVIRNTNSLGNITSVASQETQFKVFNMYNWKYIT